LHSNTNINTNTNYIDLVKRLDEEILRPRLREIHVPSLHPSSPSRWSIDLVTGKRQAVGSCLRAQYLRYKNQSISAGAEEGEVVDSEDFTANELTKFDIAYKIEDYVTELAMKAGIYEDHKVRFEIKELGMRGELDLVVWDEEGRLAGVDCKSIYGYTAESSILGTVASLRKGFRGTPREENEMQIALYLWHWRHKLDYFIIYYIHRGNGRKAQYIITISPTEGGDDYYVYRDGKKLDWTIGAVLERYRQLRTYIENDELPPRDYEIQYSKPYLKLLSDNGMLSKTDNEAFLKGRKVKKGDFQCSYCLFKNFCYDDKDNPILDDVPGPWKVVEPPGCISIWKSSLPMKSYIESLSPDTVVTITGADNYTYSGQIQDFLAKPNLRLYIRG
jgi:hypothetical protein